MIPTISPLTPVPDVVCLWQQSHQASVLRDTLKFGGFLFSVLKKGPLGLVYLQPTCQASTARGMLNSGGSLFFLLQRKLLVLSYSQPTCQASASRGMLKLGRSLFFQGVAS